MYLEDQISKFVEEQQELIALERDSEVRETMHLQSTLSTKALEKRGLCITRLRVVDESTGLRGRTLVELESQKDGPIDTGRFGSGDIVAVRSSKDKGKQRGIGRDAMTAVVFRISPARIVLALDREHPMPEEPIRLDRVANEVTYSRLSEAMAQLARYKGGPADRLRKVLFGGVEPETDERWAKDCEHPEHLDEAQRDAVTFAMSSRDVALVHGPPGTGKTTTLVEIIAESVKRGERVLACAGSNIAVDNMVERLAERGLDVVRLGHPARLLPSVLNHSLDNLVARSDANKAAQETRRDLDAAHKRLHNARDRSTRYHARDEIRELRRTLKEIERWVIDSVIQTADVVLSTNVGAADRLISGVDFQLVVIDEAAQALEASAWIPLMKGRRAVLAGDHLQLPPTIMSKKAAKSGLEVTLFERLMREHGDSISRLLTTQYRMHETIMNWSSNELYEGKLEADESVRTHLLSDLIDCESNEETSKPAVMIDTAGCGFEEEQDEDSGSKSNEGEAKIVAEYIDRLTQSGLSETMIAVIAPYRTQVRKLRAALRPQYPKLEIDTVDGFQGREKEAVVISMVRSNQKGEIGFLADHRRMNVAVTRARRHVCVIGDSATISNDAFLARLVAYFENSADYRSAWEYR